MLSDDLIDALSNRSFRLGSPHAPEIEALQPLYRALDPPVSIARVALLLLGRSVPVNDKPLAQMIGADSTFDDVESFFVPVRPLAQDLLPAHIASKHGLGKGRHVGPVLGNDRACDFLCVQTITFRTLYVFFVIHHASRQVLHVHVTPHLTTL